MKTPSLPWLFLALTALWGGLMMVGASDGAVSVFNYIFYFYGGLLFGGATLILGLILVVGNIRQGVGTWRVVPLPVALQVVLLPVVLLGVSYDAAFFARFLASRGAFQAAVDDVTAGRRLTVPRWIGLLPVREVDVAGTSVRFITGSCLFDHCGLAFSRAGEPPQVGEDSYDHLVGPWWRWHRSW